MMAAPFSFGVILSMTTAKDRENYLRFLGDPFEVTRFEPGFVLLSQLLYHISSPEFSILIISGIVYLLLALSWGQIYTGGYVGSFLSFYFSIHMFFNYFSGTAIRNGLGAAVSIFLFTILISNRSILMRTFIFTGSFLHVGAIIFSFFAFIYTLTHRYKWASYILLLGGGVAIFSFIFILPRFITSSYYLLWIEGGSFSTERFRSFSIILYSLFIFLIIFHPKRDIWYGIAIAPIPLVIFYFITGLEAFHRLLMPFFFIGAAVFFDRYSKLLIMFFGNSTYLFILISLNFVGVAYAYKQWGIIA